MTLYGQELELSLMARVCACLADRRAIDIGAEKGDVTQALLTAGYSKVFAIDPFPANVAALRSRFANDARVEVIETAVGGVDAEAVLNIACDASGRTLDQYHSLESFPDTDAIRWGRRLPVQCWTISSLIAAARLPDQIGLVKIDTEGHDLAILRKLGPLRCSIIAVEFWSDAPGFTGRNPYTVADVVAELGPRGFRDFAVIRRRDEFEMLQINSTRTADGEWGNIVFVHESVASSIRPILADLAVDAQEKLVFKGFNFRKACDERLALINAFASRPFELRRFIGAVISRVGKFQRLMVRTLSQLAGWRRSLSGRLRLGFRPPSASLPTPTYAPGEPTEFALPRALQNHLKSGKAVYLVDVGAHLGAFTAAVHRHCGVVAGILVEPLPHLAEELRSRFDLTKYTVHACAVAADSGQAEFEGNRFEPTSSLLRLKRELDELKNFDTAPGYKIKCPIRPLDDIVAESGWSSIDLLKIDVQGAEHLVLAGARSTLAITRRIWIEVSFRPLYDLSTVFEQVYQLLNTAGFRLMELEPGYRSTAGELLQADALFERVDARRVKTTKPLLRPEAVLRLEGSSDWSNAVEKFAAEALGVDEVRVRATVLNGGYSTDVGALFSVTIDGESACVLKVYREAYGASVEARMQERVIDADIEGAPHPLGIVKVMLDDTEGSALMMQQVGGVSLLAELPSVARPGTDGHDEDFRRFREHVTAVAGFMARFHRKLGTGRLLPDEVKRVHGQSALARLEALTKKIGTATAIIFTKLVDDIIPKYMAAHLIATVSHGDANLGNFLVDAAHANAVGTVDLGLMYRSLDAAGEGCETAARDIEYFLWLLRCYTTRPTPWAGNPSPPFIDDEARALESAFLDSYFAESIESRSQLEPALRFCKAYCELEALGHGWDATEPVVSRLLALR